MTRAFRAPRHQFAGTVPGQGRANVRPLSGDEMAALQPHRRSLPDGLKLAPEAVTLLGRMYLAGDLDDPHDPTSGWKRHEVGQRYRTIAQSYFNSIGSPRGTMIGGKGHSCLGDPPRCEPDCECIRRKSAYNEAFECMSGDHRAQVEVSHVSVHDKSCRNVDYLLRGLDLLVRQLLTNRRNCEYR